MKPSQQRDVASIRAELARLARYDDESIVHDRWIRQRYDGGYAVSFAPARTAAVVTAWHEAGHAVAALAVGTDFSSASIYHARDSAGRVHGIRGAGELAFVIDAAGQIAELLRDWTLPGSDDELRGLARGLAERRRRRPPLPPGQRGPVRPGQVGRRACRVAVQRAAADPVAAGHP